MRPGRWRGEAAGRVCLTKKTKQAVADGDVLRGDDEPDDPGTRRRSCHGSCGTVDRRPPLSAPRARTLSARARRGIEGGVLCVSPCSSKRGETQVGALARRGLETYALQEFMAQAWGGSADNLVASAVAVAGELGALSSRLVVKLPLTRDGVLAASRLRSTEGLSIAGICMTARGIAAYALFSSQLSSPVAHTSQVLRARAGADRGCCESGLPRSVDDAPAAS